MEGLKFMFVPGYAVEAGFVAETPSLLSVFASAGGQMFFSLSLAMGAMITYGSYLNQKEDLVKNTPPSLCLRIRWWLLWPVSR